MPADIALTSDSIDRYKGISTMEAMVAIALSSLFSCL